MSNISFTNQIINTAKETDGSLILETPPLCYTRPPLKEEKWDAVSWPYVSDRLDQVLRRRA